MVLSSLRSLWLSFINRMGGQMQYVTADNRDFLLVLVQVLEKA